LTQVVRRLLFTLNNLYEYTGKVHLRLCLKLIFRREGNCKWEKHKFNAINAQCNETVRQNLKSFYIYHAWLYEMRFGKSTTSKRNAFVTAYLFIFLCVCSSLRKMACIQCTNTASFTGIRFSGWVNTIITIVITISRKIFSFSQFGLMCSFTTKLFRNAKQCLVTAE